MCAIITIGANSTANKRHGSISFPKRSGKKTTKKLAQAEINYKKKKMKKSKPNKPTNKKYKWPDTQLTPSQPVRQKKLKNTKREIFFGVWYILSNVIYVCPAFLSGWSIHLSYFQSIEKTTTQFLGPSLCVSKFFFIKLELNETHFFAVLD
jgi:hypothetical protein